MTVQQLIRQLLVYPADSEVVVGNNIGYACKVQAVCDVTYPWIWKRDGAVNEATHVVELFLDDECHVQDVEPT